MVAYEQIRAAYMLWWLTILVNQVCSEFHMLLHRTEVLSFNYGWVLQNTGIGYWQWKIKKLVSARKSLLDWALPETESNLASSLVQLTICNMQWYWSHCQNTQKDFQVISAFGHSGFNTSQSLFVPTNVVLKWYLACRTFSKFQPYSNESCLSIHTIVKSMLNDETTCLTVFFGVPAP